MQVGLPVFADRRAAGRRLARYLARYAGSGAAVVVGLPRGGVPVAAEVASALGLPLDILLVRKLGVPGEAELARREKLYRAAAPPIPLTGRDVLLVDDGIATGATMRVAIRAARQCGAAKIIVAVPVCAASSCDSLREEADQLLCLEQPESFGAVGAGYREFGQTSDAEVMECLRAARDRSRPVDRAPGNSFFRLPHGNHRSQTL